MTGEEDPLDRLSKTDVETIRECLEAGVRLFQEWEYTTSMAGTARADVESVLERWPDRPLTDAEVAIVSHTLRYVVGYPRRESAEWACLVSATPQEIAATYSRWRGRSDPELGVGTPNRLK